MKRQTMGWMCIALMSWGCGKEDEEEERAPQDMSSMDAALPEEDMAPDLVVVEEDLGSCHATACPEGTLVNLPDHLWIHPGEGFRFAPQLLDEDGDAVADAQFEYSVDRPFLASIDEMGELTNMSSGQLVVTVKLGALEHHTRVSSSFVTPGIGSPASRSGMVGEMVEMYMERGIDPETGEIIYLEAEYESMDESVATVERDTGVVTMVGVGETVVTGVGKYQGEMMSCEIIVKSE